jgi:hypothetical protein
VDVLGRISVKLHALRAADSALHVTGAFDHRYELRPALEEAAVCDWERQAGVSLPSEYRLFLLTLGDGPAGPGFGLPCLHAVPPEPSLAASFPLAEPFLGPGAEDWDAYRASLLRWEDIPHDQGILWLTDYGCDIRGGLIVQGPHRGEIWVREGDTPLFCPFLSQLHHAGYEGPTEPCRPLTFLEWYEDWLDGGFDEIGASRPTTA